MLPSRTLLRFALQRVQSQKQIFICSGCYKRLLSTSQPCMEKRFLLRLPWKFTNRAMASSSDPAGGDNIKGFPPPDEAKTPAKPKLDIKVKFKAKPKPKTDYSQSYTDNIFMTPSRAMTEYLLSYSDLQTLKSAKRRSPFSEKEDITVYLRRDVERRAIEKYGGLDQLTKEQQKYQRKLEQDNVAAYFTKLARKQYLLEHEGIDVQSELDEKPFIHHPGAKKQEKGDSITKTGSGRVVLSAIFVNTLNTVFKTVAWLYTGSHSMFAEAVHSLADTMNQVILAIGIHQSLKEPDFEHPYGWMTMRNVASLISGVGIFCIGSMLSIYHGIEGLLHPDAIESLYWAILVLGGSFLSEGGSCLVALNETRKKAKAQGISFLQHIWSGSDPSTNVVLLEDVAAIAGLGIAATCMGISYYTGNPLADAIGSLMIGGLLGGVASFIIYTNTVTLVGRSIPRHKKMDLIHELEKDRVIRALHDVKATDMGGNSVKFKAEVDFDGREITRLYLETVDLETVLADLQKRQNVEELEQFMLEHGERIVDTMGSQVDRIEKLLKKKHPEIRHVDLEQL